MGETRRRALAGIAVAVLAGTVACGGGEGEGGSGGDESRRGDDAAGAEDGPRRREPMELAWSTEGVRFVTRPVLVAGTLVAYVVEAEKLHLVGYDPASGQERWRRPATASYLRPGDVFDVVVDGERVINMSPQPFDAPGAQGEGAAIEAVDARTGQPAWRTTTWSYGFSDAPYRCPGSDHLCAQAYGNNAQPVQWRIDPATGAVTEEQSVIRNRHLGPHLYQAENQDEIGHNRPDGSQRWQMPFSQLFGGHDVHPDFGWRWDDREGVLVGWLGAVRGEPPADRRVELPLEHTVGVDPATGETLWITEGDLLCGRLGWELQLEVDGTWPLMRCRTTGTVQLAEQSAGGLSGWDVTDAVEGGVDVDTVLEGFDPTTGEATWTVELPGFSAIYDDSRPMIRLGPHAFATRLDDDRLVAVDVASGERRRPDEHEVGWCQSNNRYRYHGGEPEAETVERAGAAFVTPCEVGGTAVDAPTAVDEGVGVVAGDVFVWMDEAGLHGARIEE